MLGNRISALTVDRPLHLIYTPKPSVNSYSKKAQSNMSNCPTDWIHCHHEPIFENPFVKVREKQFSSIVTARLLDAHISGVKNRLFTLRGCVIAKKCVYVVFDDDANALLPYIKITFSFSLKKTDYFFFLKKIDVKNMNPRLGSACHLIVYAFMQQCDDVKTIYQKPTWTYPKSRL